MQGVTIRVGIEDADVIGSDNRALQAAVDYVGGLGGGTVVIGPGEYLMRDSLHLRSRIAVRGTPGKTVLRKADSVTSPLVLDGDCNEEQITVADPAGFGVGVGVAISDDAAGGAFPRTVATIIGAEGNTFRINKPLYMDFMVHRNARAETVFPVISGYNLEEMTIEDVAIDGNRERNGSLDGCRGAGIYFFSVKRAAVRRCVIRVYNGDGISFQKSDDVVVEECVCENNAGLGLHPGSGSQRPVIRRCRSANNGRIGLFLCWRVKHGVFEENHLEANAQCGISIGHKDTDNVFRGNVVVRNGRWGVYFRPESEPMGGHRNHFEGNRIADNGGPEGGAGIRIEGETHDLSFVNNAIEETRGGGARTQQYAVSVGPKASGIMLRGNNITGYPDGGVHTEAPPGAVCVE